MNWEWIGWSFFTIVFFIIVCMAADSLIKWRTDDGE